MSAEELISIHAPRMGSDPCGGRYTRILRNFNPRPRMGSDEMDPGLVSGIYISIHAPRGGNDTPLRVHGRIQQYFNPRSPHGERLVYLS